MINNSLDSALRLSYQYKDILALVIKTQYQLPSESP